MLPDWLTEDKNVLIICRTRCGLSGPEMVSDGPEKLLMKSKKNVFNYFQFLAERAFTCNRNRHCGALVVVVCGPFSTLSGGPRC